MGIAYADLVFLGFLMKIHSDICERQAVFVEELFRPRGKSATRAVGRDFIAAYAFDIVSECVHAYAARFSAEVSAIKYDVVVLSDVGVYRIPICR